MINPADIASFFANLLSVENVLNTEKTSIPLIENKESLEYSKFIELCNKNVPNLDLSPIINNVTVSDVIVPLLPIQNENISVIENPEIIDILTDLKPEFIIACEPVINNNTELPNTNIIENNNQITTRYIARLLIKNSRTTFGTVLKGNNIWGEYNSPVDGTIINITKDYIDVLTTEFNDKISEVTVITNKIQSDTILYSNYKQRWSVIEHKYFVGQLLNAVFNSAKTGMNPYSGAFTEAKLTNAVSEICKTISLFSNTCASKGTTITTVNTIFPPITSLLFSRGFKDLSFSIPELVLDNGEYKFQGVLSSGFYFSNKTAFVNDILNATSNISKDTFTLTDNDVLIQKDNKHLDDYTQYINRITTTLNIHGKNLGQYLYNTMSNALQYINQKQVIFNRDNPEINEGRVILDFFRDFKNAIEGLEKSINDLYINDQWNIPSSSKVGPDTYYFYTPKNILDLTEANIIRDSISENNPNNPIDANFKDTNNNQSANQPGIESNNYWKRWCNIASLVNLLPIYWPIGLLIPTPGGLIKIPIPIIWKSITAIPTPLCTIVIGITICGICPCPFIYVFNPNWDVPIQLAQKNESYFVLGIRGPQKIATDINNKTLESLIPTLTKNYTIKQNNVLKQTMYKWNILGEFTKKLPLFQEDHPPFNKLSLKNILWLKYLTKWCTAGKKTYGFFENP
jgi:hypothetical protein